MSHALRPSQVHERKPASDFFGPPGCLLGLVQVYVEDGVASAGGEVHALAGHLPVFQAGVDDSHGLFQGAHGHFDQVFHKDFALLFADGQVAVERVEEVLDLFLINLEEGKVQLPVQQEAEARLFGEEAEQEVQGGGDHALASRVQVAQHAHGMRLARACLAVDEEAPVVAIQSVEY